MIRTRQSVAAIALTASTLVGIAMQEHFVKDAMIPVPGDVPTIGFGTTAGVKMGDTITPERALMRLLDEVDSVYAQGVRKCVKVPLHTYEFGAYVSLAYNIGVGAFCKKADKRTVDDKGNPKLPEPDRLIDLINAERYEEACERIEAFKYGPGRKVLKGLVKRRAEERAICEGKRESV